MPFLDKDKARSASAAWNKRMRGSKEGWPRTAVYRAKQSAKKLGVPFDLKPEDIKIPDVCPITGCAFVYSAANSPDAPSLDRFRPELGYVRGNVKVISYKANAAKQDITDPAVFERLAEYVRG